MSDTVRVEPHDDAQADTGAATDSGGRERFPVRWYRSFSFPGLVVGGVFLCLSMTPSLLPRAALLQGVLSGITAAFGYGLGAGARTLWRYLELPEPATRHHGLIRRIAFGLVGLALLWFLWQLVGWQDNLRGIFGMAEVNEPLFAVTVLVVAAVTWQVLIWISRGVAWVVRRLARAGERALPPRVGRVLGAAAGVALVVLLLNGVLIDGLVAVANRSFAVQNGLHEAGVDQPDSTLRSGGPESLVGWDTLGQPGRKWVARGPTAADIAGFTGDEATEPIRVYVGLDSAGTVEQRADLALRELVRTGAFDREVLVVATSTGSGGLDPNGTEVVEYLHGGDTAIAGFQYSFLPSWLSFYVDQEAARETAKVVFETVHDHWQDLPEDDRPELYLFGVSLGSYGSEASSTSLRTIDDPVDGAVWAGPTFLNSQWVGFTQDRDPGSPAWLPVYDDGRVVRFTGRTDALDLPGTWEDSRVVYIEHPSDPVSFFSPDLLWSEPAWLSGERSPEMSPDMHWYPGVTFWQVALDLPMGGSVPPGYGHNFAVDAYVDAWAGVSGPGGWTSEDSDRLKGFLADR